MNKPLTRLLATYEREILLPCDEKRCTQLATQILIAHPLDHCIGGAHRSYLLCHDCATRNAAKIGKQIKKLFRPGAPAVACRTCFRALRTPEDLYRVEDLYAS
jgi:hypothetical protein